MAQTNPPQATTANTAQPTPGTPPPAPQATSLPAFNVPSFFNAIESMIAGATQENCLNTLFNSTYHWRLFMAPDSDILTQTGQPSSMQAVHAGLANVPQINIAESGDTIYNIRDVQFTTVCAGHEITQAEGTQTWTVTITEPNGISFLDAMLSASATLGINNFTKAPFYLMVTFIGYNESGQFVSNPAGNFSTTGRWLWAVTCTNIEVKLNEAGAVYTCRFVPSNEAHMMDQYDVTRTPQSFKCQGDTIGELFTDYIKRLNNAWKIKYKGEMIVFDGIDTKQIGAYFKYPESAAGLDPKNFKMKSETPDQEPNRSWEFNSKTGKYTVNVTPGYTISNFIVDALKHTVQGQALAKSDPIVSTTDVSATAINATNIRESITFVVEPIMTVTQFDDTHKNYQRHIKFVVSPNYSQAAAISAVQRDAAKTKQYDMVSRYIQNGLLRKQYNYIFTGENTEVLDFDLNFNTAWNALIANYAGALMRNDAVKQAALQSKITQSPTSNYTEDNMLLDLVATGNGASAASTGGPAASNPTASVLRVAGGAAGSSQVSVPNVKAAQDLPAPQVGKDFAAPIAYWQGLNQIDNASGLSTFVGQQNRDQPVLGSIWAQIYGQSSVTNAYQSVKLTIRGDPFWLGQSNIHRQVQLLNNNLSVAQQDLLDMKAAMPVIYLYFRYPPYVDDTTFKPALQSSAIFNGLYSVNQVEHHFADGVFKQVLHATKVNLIDSGLWTLTANNSSSIAPSAAAGTGGAPSSPQQTGTSGPRATTGSVTPGSGTLPNAGTFNDKAPALTQRLMDDYGLTKEQASGIVGNFGYESNGLTADQQEIGQPQGSGGYGLGQWTGSRRTDLMNYAANTGQDPSDVNTQYGFLQQELAGPQKSALNAVRNTDNTTDATAAFENTFERPANPSSSLQARINYANQAASLPSPTQNITTASNP